MQKVNKIVVIGSDVDAWYAAAYVAKSWPTSHVTIISTKVDENPKPFITTTPIFKKNMEFLGLDETQWFDSCRATYKIGNVFHNWNNSSSFHHTYPTDLDSFYNPFFYNMCELRRKSCPIDIEPDKYFIAALLAENHRVPVAKYSFPFEVHYGYHISASELVEVLKNKALSLGVVEKPALIESFRIDTSKNIQYLSLDDGTQTSADIYINSSKKVNNVSPLKCEQNHLSYDKQFVNDRCVSISVEAPNTNAGNRTVCTALPEGWLQVVPLQNRTHYSLYHCSKINDENQIKSALINSMKFTNSEPNFTAYEACSYRSFETYNDRFLTIGEAQGYIDPLEIDTLHFTQRLLTHFVSSVNQGTKFQHKTFNNDISRLYDTSVDYTQAHYLLSSKFKSPYWEHVKTKCEPSDALKSMMQAWISGAELPRKLTDDSMTPFNVLAWACLFAGHNYFPTQDSNMAIPYDFQKITKKRNDFYRGCLLNFPQLTNT